VTPAPPRLAERGLGLLEPDADWRDAILGDLREEFPIIAERHGAPYARRWYWAHALGIALHRAGSRLTPGRRRHALPFTEPPEPRASRVSLLLHDVRAAWRSVGHGVLAIVSGLPVGRRHLQPAVVPDRPAGARDGRAHGAWRDARGRGAPGLRPGGEVDWGGLALGLVCAYLVGRGLEAALFG
jgi:hypothetical protein